MMMLESEKGRSVNRETAGAQARGSSLEPIRRVPPLWSIYAARVAAVARARVEMAGRALQLGDRSTVTRFFDEFFDAGASPVVLEHCELTDVRPRLVG